MLLILIVWVMGFVFFFFRLLCGLCLGGGVGLVFVGVVWFVVFFGLLVGC